MAYEQDQSKADTPQRNRPGRPPAYRTAKSLQKAIDAYLKSCEAKPLMYELDGKQHVATDAKGNPVIIENPPTIAGLAYELGFVSRQSIYDLEKRCDQFSYAIKRARLFIESHHEANLSTRDKPVGDIFWMKNHGWSDKQEFEHSGSVAVQIVDDIK